MMNESPMRISACMILPSGPTARATSSAPRAFLYQSIAFAALSSISCGVTVWCPSGIGFFAFAITDLLSCREKNQALHCDVIRTSRQADENERFGFGHCRGYFAVKRFASRVITHAHPTACAESSRCNRIGVLEELRSLARASFRRCAFR